MFLLFFVVLFGIICLIIQEKRLAWSLFVNHFDFPGSDSRDVMMAKIMVRAIPIGSNAKFTSPSVLESLQAPNRWV